METISKLEAEQIKARKQNELLLGMIRQLIDKPEGTWKQEMMQSLTAELQKVVQAIQSIPKPEAGTVEVNVDNSELISQLQKIVSGFEKKFEYLDTRMDELVKRPAMEIHFTRNANGYINSPVKIQPSK
jgi:hypothetical protein